MVVALRYEQCIIIGYLKNYFDLAPKTNWLINGNAETGSCELGGGVTHPTGWNYNDTITQLYYNNPYGSLLLTDPGPR